MNMRTSAASAGRTVAANPRSRILTRNNDLIDVFPRIDYAACAQRGSGRVGKWLSRAVSDTSHNARFHSFSACHFLHWRHPCFRIVRRRWHERADTPQALHLLRTQRAATLQREGSSDIEFLQRLAHSGRWVAASGPDCLSFLICRLVAKC
jgi:hypothetical protein